MGKEEDIIDKGREEKVNTATLGDLLEWDGTIDIQDNIELPALDGGRPALTITVKSLSATQMDKCREMATMEGVGKNGMTLKEVDDDVFQLLVLFYAIEDPDLTSPALQGKFNANSQQAYIVNKLFLPGEQERLIRKIFNLSGYNVNADLEFKKSDTDLF